MHLSLSTDAQPPIRLGPVFQQPDTPKRTLRIALLISVLIHGAALTWVRFDLPEVIPPIATPTIAVTLIAAPPEVEPAIEKEPNPAVEAPSLVPQIPPTAQQVPLQPANDKPSVRSDPVDWESLVSTNAQQATMQKLAQERHREAMWRKTFSVMFARPEDWLIEDEPYLPDLQFEADKRRRLGLRISENCYLGFPGIDPETVDTDAPGWSGGGAPQPTLKMITCGFGD